MYKKDFALNNLQYLICHKTKLNQINSDPHRSKALLDDIFINKKLIKYCNFTSMGYWNNNSNGNLKKKGFIRPNELGQWRPAFNPWSSHTKDSKNVIDAALLNTQHYKVRIKGKVEQSREWNCTLTYTLV